MTRAFKILLTAILVPVIVVLAGRAAVAWPDTWQSSELRGHPLVGQIYDTKARKFIAPDAYFTALREARFVLLGEVHDNADHHILQGETIRRLKGVTRAVVFEHFRADQQDILSAFFTGKGGVKSDGGDDFVEKLFLVTGWETSGWPEKAIYRPLMAAVIEGGAKIIAGNPQRQRVREVARQGLPALSGDGQRELLLDRPLGRQLDDDLLAELEASHCGLMPRSAFGGMAVAQRFRDGFMARVMVDAALKEGTVVLAAGNGHVRLDRAVPWYLRQMARVSEGGGSRAIAAVGHLEVAEDQNDPSAYGDLASLFSYVVFTPRALRPDPCEEMRKQFKPRNK